MIFIGIDNGVTGNVTILSEQGNVIQCVPIPTKKELNYTKKKAFFTRIDHPKLVSLLNIPADEGVKCLIERPLVNPSRWIATASALRAWESTLLAFEATATPYGVLDIKEWQKAMLPSGLKGPELKIAAFEVAKRIFPSHAKKENADSMLIAEYLRRRETRG